MKREVFDDYIKNFNARDASAFEDYIDPNAKVLNGTLEIQGMQGMKNHYARIWRSFSAGWPLNYFLKHSVSHPSLLISGNEKMTGVQVPLAISDLTQVCTLPAVSPCD
jgi:hypothetical protein